MVAGTTGREAGLRAEVRAGPGLRVLTGGQTGVDTWAAQAALRAGLPVHLVFPAGWRQEDGPLTASRRGRLAGASLHELGSASFRYRTWTLVYLSDAVVLIDPAGGEGCRETARAAQRLGRPLLATEPCHADTAQLADWLARASARVLMVAGCRASVLRQAGRTAAARGQIAAIMDAARLHDDRLAGYRRNERAGRPPSAERAKPAWQ